MASAEREFRNVKKKTGKKMEMLSANVANVVSKCFKCCQQIFQMLSQQVGASLEQAVGVTTGVSGDLTFQAPSGPEDDNDNDNR